MPAVMHDRPQNITKNNKCERFFCLCVYDVNGEESVGLKLGQNKIVSHTFGKNAMGNVFFLFHGFFCCFLFSVCLFVFFFKLNNAKCGNSVF